MELGYLSHTHLFFVIPLLYSIYKQNSNKRRRMVIGKNKTKKKLKIYDAL